MLFLSSANNFPSVCVSEVKKHSCAMKHCVTVRWVFGVFCVVLVRVPMGWTRPANPQATYPPPLNCSNPAVWSPERHPHNPSEDLEVDPVSDADDLIPRRSHPTSSPRALRYRHSTPHSVPDFYSQEEAEYFDYYYEEVGEMNSDLEDTFEGGQPVGYQQPPPGLSRVAKLKLIKTPRRQPPEYMLELYDRFSRAKPPVTTYNPKEPVDQSDLGADIVRSFPNINKEDSADVGPTGENEANTTDDESQLAGGDTRHHTLVFNITSLLTGEEVSRAELRLYTLMEHDRNTYVGEDRIVRVYEGLNTHHLSPVASRHMYGHSGGWEAFDVTSVVQAWVTKGSRTGDGVQVLEVKIDTLFQSGEKGSGTTMDIDVDPEHNEGPILVVFSKDTSWHLQQELRDLINHEAVSEEETDDSDDTSDSSDYFSSTEESRSARDEPVSSRTQRSVDRSRDLFLSMSAVPAKPEEPLRRVRREKRKRNSCRRKTMYVDFQDINWDQWIIAPPGYMAFECVGKCYFPIGAHLSPTKHAIVQTMVHETHPKRAARACCVPTKLDPISILYLDENNVITYKYHYDGMVVARCGCR